MALKSTQDLIKGRTLTPNSEARRIKAIVANRRLYNGDLSQLGVGSAKKRERGFAEIDSQSDNVGYENKINWFRRVADFYSEFMFSTRPEITTGNPRFDMVIDEIKDDLMQPLEYANTDMLAYGEGVIATHPADSLRFVEWAPDAHYVLTDERGIIVGDVLVNVRAARAGDSEDEIDVITYYVDSERKNTWDTYRYQNGNIGEFKRFNVMAPTQGRQVVELHHNKSKTSMFDDMKDATGELGRILTGMSSTVARNTNPHLAGPSGMLAIDANGKATVEESGMFLPVEEGEHMPGYVVWDPNLSAVQWDYKQSERNALTAAGLSDAIFDPAIFTGTLSGTALRRILLPFAAKLETLATESETAIVKTLEILNANRAALGVEVFSFERRNVQITWHHRELFEAQESNGQPNDAESSQGN